jgi:hypothetical protein
VTKQPLERLKRSRRGYSDPRTLGEAGGDVLNAFADQRSHESGVDRHLAPDEA